MKAMILALLGLLAWLIYLVIRLRSEALVNRRVIGSLQKAWPVTEQKYTWASPVPLQSIAYTCVLLLVALLFLLLPIGN